MDPRKELSRNSIKTKFILRATKNWKSWRAMIVYTLGDTIHKEEKKKSSKRFDLLVSRITFALQAVSNSA